MALCAYVASQEHSCYDVYELRDAKQKPVGRLEGFANIHHSTICELRKVLKVSRFTLYVPGRVQLVHSLMRCPTSQEMQGESDEAVIFGRARRTPKKDKKRGFVPSSLT